MEVSDVLRDRMQEPRGLPTTAAVSLAVHLAVGAALLLGPLRFLSRPTDDQKPVMTISLGGSGVGPQAGGLTSIGQRAVQTTEPATKPEAVRAPAAAVPKMTVPIEKAAPAKPAKTPPPKELEDVDKIADARGRTLARGDELRTGSAVGFTGARGQGFGLSTGGSGGMGATLDVGNFCCPDYLVLLQQRITSNWNQQAEVAGTVVVKFTIQRDGRLTGISLEQSSGSMTLDDNAKRSVEVTRQLTPLPSDYPNTSLTVHLTFKYQR